MINSEIYFQNFESIDKEKKSILFIAGAGMDHRLVRSLKLPDSEFNKPLIIDLPGHGESKGSSSNSIEFYSKFLIDCLDSYDLNNFSICGHSMGGLVALEIGRQKVFSIQSIVLVNSIYPTRVAEPLLTKARVSNGDAADFIIKYGLHKRLLGIKNAFSEEDLINFEKKISNFLDKKNNFEIEYSAEPKIDGISASLTYRKGKFVTGLSRETNQLQIYLYGM